jgi:hypothetical protein
MAGSRKKPPAAKPRPLARLQELQAWAKGGFEPPRPALSVSWRDEASAADPFAVSCAGKEGFPNEQAAYAAQQYRVRNGVKNAGLSAYKCAFCKRWHLGHPRAK